MSVSVKRTGGLGQLYQPLDKNQNQIRIVTVLGRPDVRDDLPCSLDIISLQDKPNFVALSYQWHPATPPDCKPLSLRTTEGHGLKLQVNLSSYLRHHASPGLRLWIDAICIDQNNLEERSQQVTIMDRIYRESARLHIWLGPEQNNSGLALEMLEKSRKSWDRIRALGVHAQQYMARTRLSHMSMQTKYDRTWAAIKALLDRPYWGRGWILQEVLLGRDSFLIAGQHQASFSGLIVLWISCLYANVKGAPVSLSMERRSLSPHDL